MTAIRKAEIKKMNAVEIIEQIVIGTKDSGKIEVKGSVKKFVDELSSRLGIEPMETLLFSVIVDYSLCRNFYMQKLAAHFNCRTTSLLSKLDAIDSLLQKRVIVRKKDFEGNIQFCVPQRTLDALRHDRLPEQEKFDGLSAEEWIDTVDRYIEERGKGLIPDDELTPVLNILIEKNQHLHIARQLKGLGLEYSNLLLFFVISLCFINNHNDNVTRSDISEYFTKRRMLLHSNSLERGSHILMSSNLVEHNCADGQADTGGWRLTDHAKYELFSELNLKQPATKCAKLTHCDDIKMKSLYYTPKVERQVNELQSLLQPEKMGRVLSRLESAGMRRGFTCIFYGAPGTGKTETVMQLARETKRHIMVVDIQNIRSKWVGETEKNIKRVFDQYREAVKNQDNGNQPILLFNEADAILTKRNENSVNEVDKMENAMQNIILQEMESLEGIMIATTNLTGSLDAAFERRFLYKIEFERPTPKERQHIWQSMIPDLTEEQSFMLADRFDFSGGQIENITRKRIIGDILAERDTLDIDSIIDNCKSELLGKRSDKRRIGF